MKRAIEQALPPYALANGDGQIRLRNGLRKRLQRRFHRPVRRSRPRADQRIVGSVRLRGDR